jgi:hypothetical protein
MSQSFVWSLIAKRRLVACKLGGRTFVEAESGRQCVAEHLRADTPPTKTKPGRKPKLVAP